MRRKLVAGNWKMNGTSAELDEIGKFRDAAESSGCDVVVCPPFTLLHRMSLQTRETAIATGGQNCHHLEAGAQTGEISARMLADAGATYCIVGHSERRHGLGETNDLVRRKAEASVSAGLVTILCVGETEDERLEGLTDEVVGAQISECVPKSADPENFVVAYEPVWAIGTGRTADGSQIREAHAFIRAECRNILGTGPADELAILYGGSVNPGNAAEIFAIENVDGGLVGGASLKGDDFAAIIRTYRD